MEEGNSSYEKCQWQYVAELIWLLGEIKLCRKYMLIFWVWRGENKIDLFKSVFPRGRTRAVRWEVANFLEWNVWGVTKEWIRVVFQIGSLNITDEREKTGWRGLEMILENNCFLRLGARAGITTSKKKKVNEVASLFCNTRGRQGLHFDPASCITNKDLVFCNLTLLMFLGWLRGLLHLFCLTLISSLSVIS